MGWFKKLDLFCRIYQLNLNKPGTIELFKASLKHGLTDDQIVRMIDRRSTPCPQCSRGMVRNYWQGKWKHHCFYCGHDELTAVSNDDPDLEIEREIRLDQKAEKTARALRLWDQATSITNTPAETYLRARGLDPPPDADSVLRWHSACEFGLIGNVGCMVALFRDAVTDQAVGLHRTHIISARLGKSDRMALGQMSRAVIKLWRLNNSEHLAVGEGIENVLAAVQLGIADPPAWASTVANNLSRVPVIPGIKQLTILADNDVSCTGEQHARGLRRRWLDHKRKVLVKIPTQVGKDFNDILRGQS